MADDIRKGRVYDLHGRKIGKTGNVVYIVNGKKKVIL